MESGPFRIDGKGGLKLITGGWEEFSTIIFRMVSITNIYNALTSFSVDQPAGTGLSYAPTDSYVTELTQVSSCLNEALTN